MNYSPEEWMDEILNALEYRRVFGCEDAWNKLEIDYLNDPLSDTAVGPNLVFSEGDTLLSALTVPNPYFVVYPDDPFCVESAPVVEYLENYLIKPNKMNLKDKIELSILHGYIACRAIMKIGYD